MGFLKRSSNAKPDYTALQLQTSVSILPIPIVWGKTKLAPNLIWYANFQAVPGGSGKGAGGKGGGLLSGGASSSQYTYTADIMMALCEGPINAIGDVWKDLGIYGLEQLGLGYFNGSTPQSVWPYLAAIYPYNALPYQGTAYVWAAGYNLGNAAAIGNHNFEVFGPLSGSMFHGIDDADPAQVIQDFLTNAQYGAGFNPASIDSVSLLTGPGSLPRLLCSDGLRFFARARQSGTSVEHPDALAADFLDCGRLERRPSQIHPLRGHGDLARVTQTRSVQLSIPIPIRPSSGELLPAFVTVSPTDISSRMAGSSMRSTIPFVFHRSEYPERCGRIWNVGPRDLHFRASRTRASRSSSHTRPPRPGVSRRI